MGKEVERWSPLAAVLLVAPYVVQAAFRTDIYGDTYSYRRAFWEIPNQLGELSQYLDTIEKDRGFTVFSAIIKLLVGNSDVLFFLVVASVQMICLVLIYRKYSCNYWLSFFVFVASTDYMSWFHNGIRQFMAVVLILVSLELLLKKRYIPLIAVILLASTFHASALVMLPVIFIVQGKAWNKKSLLMIVAAVFVLAYVEEFTTLLDSSLVNTQYSTMVTDWTEWKDDGTNPLRVLVYSIPMILSIVGYRIIRLKDEPLINVLVNFSILTFAIALISMVTSGIFIGRMIIYGSV